MGQFQKKHCKRKNDMDLQKDRNYEYVHKSLLQFMVFLTMFLSKKISQNDNHQKDHLVNLDFIVLTNRMIYYLIGR